MPVTGWAGRWVAGGLVVLAAWWLVDSLRTEGVRAVSAAEPTVARSNVR